MLQTYITVVLGWYINIISINELCFFFYCEVKSVKPKMLLTFFNGKVLTITYAGILS